MTRRVVAAGLAAVMLVSAPMQVMAAPMDQYTVSRLPDRAGRLGIEFELGQPVRATDGTMIPTFLVKRIIPAGPADQTDLRVGDLIWALNGQTFADVEAVRYYFRSREPGQPLRISVLRAGQRSEIMVTMGRSQTAMAPNAFAQATPPSPPRTAQPVAPPPVAQAPPRLGVDYRDGTPLYDERGSEVANLEVLSVVRDSAAEYVGLRQGDRILSVDGIPVGRLGDLGTYVRGRPANARVDVRFLRGDAVYRAGPVLDGRATYAGPPNNPPPSQQGSGEWTRGEQVVGAIVAAVVARGIYCWATGTCGSSRNAPSSNAPGDSDTGTWSATRPAADSPTDPIRQQRRQDAEARSRAEREAQEQEAADQAARAAQRERERDPLGRW